MFAQKLVTDTGLTDQVMSLRTLADEVSRVSLEVGSKGRLGGQAHVPDVEGVWKDLTVNVSSDPRVSRSRADFQVNRMCQNLTTQVRSIATVTTAVARVSSVFECKIMVDAQGDLSKMIEIEAEGEMAILKNVS